MALPLVLDGSKADVKRIQASLAEDRELYELYASFGLYHLIMK